MEDTETPNDGVLRVRAPLSLIVLADRHARGQDMSLAAFTRAALALALKVEGVQTPRLTKPTRDRRARLLHEQTNNKQTKC
jgi:hypothetical protein